MLIAKLPTEVSPPKMSIFWAVPWRGDYGELAYKKKLIEAYNESHEIPGLWEEVQEAISKGDWNPPDIGSQSFSNTYSEVFPGREPNWAGAMAIQYKSEKIRVFPHEFSKIDDNTLKIYIAESHEFVLGEVPEGEALKTDMEVSPEKRSLYEAAILEGASKAEAILLSAGLMQIEEGTEVKPTGWYRCKLEYAQIFCNKREMGN